MFPTLRREVSKRRRGALDVAPLLSSPRPERKLVAVLDVDSYPSAAVDDLLMGLLGHDDVRVWRYSQDGPPPSLPREVDSLLGASVEDWLLVEEEPDRSQSWEVRYRMEDSVGSSAVGLSGGEIELLGWDRDRTGAYPNASESAARERMRQDVLALYTAEAVDADLLVTTRPYLLEPRRRVAGGCRATPLPSSDAVPLVGLFLRRYGEFIYSRTDTHEQRGSSVRWYRDAALALIPGLGPWLHAVQMQPHPSRASHLKHVALTTFDRLARVVRARDHVHMALNSPLSDESIEDAMTALDDLTVAAQAALDASAQVCVAVLGLEVGRMGRAWHRKELPDELERLREGRVLAEAVTSSPGKDVLGIISGLRNTVHGAGLVGVGVKGSAAGEVSTVVLLPPDATERIIAAIDALGGGRVWGVRRSSEDQILVDPGVVVERLVAHLVTLMDELLSGITETCEKPSTDLPRGFASPQPTKEPLLAQLAVGQ